jgi:hypothetical protein
VRVALFPPVVDDLSIQTEREDAPLNMLGFDEIARGKTWIAGRCCNSAQPCRSKASPRLESTRRTGAHGAAANLKPSSPL